MCVVVSAEASRVPVGVGVVYICAVEMDRIDCTTDGAPLSVPVPGTGTRTRPVRLSVVSRRLP